MKSKPGLRGGTDSWDACKIVQFHFNRIQLYVVDAKYSNGIGLFIFWWELVRLL